MSQQRIELILDEDDAQAVNEEFARRQLCRDQNGVILPDGKSNLPGSMVAEMARDLNEYRALCESEREGPGQPTT